MKPVPALAAGLDEAGGFEDFQVLRDRLPGESHPVFHDQPCA
jgi:hypothetical protein